MAGGSLLLLFRLSLRSLVSHRVKGLIVGSLLGFGALLLVVGTAFTDSVERSMQRSIVSSLAGDLQVYSADAEDPLALFGGFGMGSEDIGELEDIAEVRSALLELPNVEAIIPMGLLSATVTTQGELDRALSALREAVRAGDEAQVRALIPRVRQVLAVLEQQLENAARITVDTEQAQQDLAKVRSVTRDAFWRDFDDAPLEKLEVLDTEIAPLSSAGQLVYVRILGTDLDRFQRAFDRFRLVRGELVPEGRRGLLLNQRFLEEQLKLPVARDLDDIYEEVTREGRRIAEDPTLRAQIERNARRYGSLLMELAPAEARELSAELAPLVGPEGGLGEQLQRFLRVDDESLEARYRFFYEEIAPKVDLYAFDVGDVITLQSFTRAGYPRAVNVRIWGTFTFEGLERSDLAGVTNLIDLVTFRELYGQPTAETRAELEAIREAAGIEDIPREEAEAELFGGGELVVEEEAGGGGFTEEEVLEVEERGADRPFSPAEVERGLALSAAVILDDPEQTEETLARIRQVSEAEGLGLQAVTWREASGLVGQFVTVVRVVLYVALLIIFAVAIVIINNSMVISTLERVNEIGTLRALGAQRGFVRAMLLIETTFLAVLAGAAGALVGVGVVWLLGAVGVPAPNDVLVFLFGGPRLYPTLGVGNVVLALVVIAAVSLVATLYPARLATRVPPVVAMQRTE